jgi:DNA-binding protein
MSTQTQKKTTTPSQEPGNKIQVSNKQKNISFYVFLAKKYLQKENEVELSGLGNAITTVVSCAEILKNNEYVVINKIQTSSVDVTGRNSNVKKPKIQIFISKAPKFKQLMEEEEKRRTESEQKKENKQ